MRVAWLEPRRMEVEKGDNQDSEKERAVDTRAIQDIGSGYEEDEIYRRSVCSIEN